MNILNRIKHIRNAERDNRRKRQNLRNYILSGYEHFSWQEVLQVFIEAYGTEEAALNVLRNLVLQRSSLGNPKAATMFNAMRRGIGIGSTFADGVACQKFIARLAKVMDAEARKKFDYSGLSNQELLKMDKTTFLL